MVGATVSCERVRRSARWLVAACLPPLQTVRNRNRTDVLIVARDDKRPRLSHIWAEDAEVKTPREAVIYHRGNSCRKVCEIDHSFWKAPVYCLCAMKKKRSTKQMLALRCPTCGAAPKERCKLINGQPRTALHRDRRLMAADKPS
jgi:hypothetical protein